MKSRFVRLIVATVSTAALAVGCGKSGPPAFPVPEVDVVVARAQTVPLTRDFVGRLSATRAADVRARVPGVLLKRLYVEGSEVKEGQPLFQIDPAPFKAALDAADAALAQAEANATNARLFAQRTRELKTTGAVSKSDVDTAEANERSTAAAVKQASANLETARINLGYATVRAPISGRSSQQRVTEGALVGQGEATLLTTVEQIDPIYVNFDRPASEVQELRRAQAAGSVSLLEGNKATVQLMFADGTAYGQPGTLDFSDASVDPNTGAVAFRALVPNPDHRLLPGLFVNLRITLGELKQAFLVPQLAVLRDGTGPYVMVVGADGNVAQKRIELGSTQESNWVVTKGLADGDQIVVSGLQKVHPGAPAKAVVGGAPNPNAPAPAPAGAPPAAH
ncbi:MAG TPA: efflux RND transporter periplasmic adaptor subunit [Steroidobacteraceae bacterium]|jgi:membrane fusion protein (multidrug efflux system)